MKLSSVFLVFGLAVTPLTSAWAQSVVVLTPRKIVEKPCRDCRPVPAAERFANLQKNAKKNDPRSQYLLGMTYLNGDLDQAVDKAQGVKWLTQAAEMGSAPAAMALSHIFETSEPADPAQAISWLQKAVQAGDGQAALALAQHYDTGKDIARDRAQAMALYERAADSVPLVFTRLCHDHGQASSSAEDWALAAVYCQKAGERGDADAFYRLGVAYSEGANLKKDSALALRAFQRASSAGHLPATEALARTYTDGGFTPKDDAQAFLWQSRAARLGSMPAVLAMAQAFESGTGVTADPAEAARLYDILARNGEASGVEWLKAHPQVKSADLARDTLTVAKVPQGVILYAVDSLDPRFQTVDMLQFLQLQAQNAYPARAANEQITGSAMAECRIMSTGDLSDCVLVQETPKDYGFGLTLMRLVDRLQNSGNKTEWTKRFAGKTLRISLDWRLDG